MDLSRSIVIMLMVVTSVRSLTNLTSSCLVCSSNSSSRCLNPRRICDGRIDCATGDDEQMCQFWKCHRGFSKCPHSNTQCVRTKRICDGLVHCNDGSDEDEDFCSNFECAPNFLKCADNLQCVHKSNFCNKRVRGVRQYQCQDGSDESQWACRLVNRRCETANHLWACDKSTNSSQCIALTKVCDGKSLGLTTNECEKGEDEDEDMCREFTCPINHVKCGHDDNVCIHVERICDAKPDCPSDGRDEFRMPIDINGEMNELSPFDVCREAGSPCLLVSHSPEKVVANGRRCDFSDNFTCTEQSSLCDGNCDCESSCFDESLGFCQKQDVCSQGQFRCNYSGRCLSRDRVCDSNFDCGHNDASDEVGCECETLVQSHSSLYTRPLILSILKEMCGLDSHSVQCIRDHRMNFYIDSEKKLIHLWSKCQFDEGHFNTNCLFNGTEVSRVDDHFAATLLPLVHRGYTYSFLPKGDLNYESMSHSTKIFDDEVSERLGALLSLLDSKSEECNWARVSFFNDFDYTRLPPTSPTSVRNYFYSQLHARLASFELLFALNCFKDNSSLETKIVFLNDVFPTLIYGPGMESDKKNLPINLVVFKADQSCLNNKEETKKAKMALLTLLHFYKSFDKDPDLVTANEGDKVNVDKLMKVLCGLDEVHVFDYVYSLTNITYLVILDKTISNKMFVSKEMRLKLRNVRRQSYHTFRLGDRSFSKNVDIVIRHVDQRSTPIDRRLLHELLLRPSQHHEDHGHHEENGDHEDHRQQEDQLEGHYYVTLRTPREHRNYVALNQRAANCSLEQALALFNITTSSKSSKSSMFYSVCDRSSACDMEFLSDADRISKVLHSRWSRSCLNVRLDGREYKILEGSSDKFIFRMTQKLMKPINGQTLGSWPSLSQRRLLLDVVTEEDDEVVVLVDVHGSITLDLCPLANAMMEQSAFYEPLLLSALLHHNLECLSELCSPHPNFFEYRRRGEFNILGPLSSLWTSSCFSELGLELVSEILEAEKSGLLTINKFWAFDTSSFNHLIYHGSHLHMETAYLSQLSFGLELLLTFTMILVALATILGNTLVLLAILMDGVVKKSLYQYLQMSLCLADVLMGLAGGLGIVVTQIQLFMGDVDIKEFVENNAFVDAFNHPKEALRSGLNNFYFITNEPIRVILGTSVCLSTTTSLTLLCLMAYTRYNVVSSVQLSSLPFFNWLTKHPWLASTSPWLMGTLLALLNFVDFSNGLRLKYQAFFDPVSKVTLLLPASTRPINFYLQALISVLMTLLTLSYSLLGLRVIQRHTALMRQREVMLTQSHEMERRMREERNWLHLTMAITLAFVISTVPLFLFYVSSALFHVQAGPVIQLAVWWLLVCGSLFNVAIYTSFNESMKRTVLRLLHRLMPTLVGASTLGQKLEQRDLEDSRSRRRARFGRGATLITTLNTSQAQEDNNEMATLN